MRWIDLRMKPWLRLGLYNILALSWLTGLAFYALRRWFQVTGEFGLETHPWQASVLTAHGGFAMLMIAGLGAILASHVPMAWRTGRSRVHGLFLLSSVSSMAASGWLLYYLASETVREWVGLIHLFIGISLPLQLSLHIMFGRRASLSMVTAKQAAAIVQTKLVADDPADAERA